jgi:hypothetical protein
MKTTNPVIRGSTRPSLFGVYCLFILCILSNGLQAQIQQAWVARYNNGITNGTNQAVKMALDPAGNIYITGFSQNSNTNLGYVTIKYAPTGTQLWTARYDSTNYSSATPAALALDSSNNVFITGNGLTIKYALNGNQLWTAPYAGTALAVDSNGNCVVTGISTTFGTVKLNPGGSNVWLGTYPSCGPGIGQQVVVAPDNSIYVAGSYTYQCYENYEYREPLVIKYGANGTQIWTTNYEVAEAIVQVAAIALDTQTNLYVELGQCVPSAKPYWTFKIANNGSVTWIQGDPTGDSFSQAYGLALDNLANVIVTGKNAFNYPSTSYGTYKVNTNGVYVWTNLYPKVVVGSNVAASIAIDSANNCYVTGYSPGTNSGNDIVTIKYDNNGNQIWVQRYNGPGNGNDVGNAIAVDNNGNVYVTGYSANASGGTDIVTIKYSPLSLQRRADGTVLLQAQGSPGESFDIQASADLQSWLDLGSVMADTNGLMQFDDTNASNYNARFYLTSPQ